MAALCEAILKSSLWLQDSCVNDCCVIISCDCDKDDETLLRFSLVEESFYRLN